MVGSSRGTECPESPTFRAHTGSISTASTATSACTFTCAARTGRASFGFGRLNWNHRFTPRELNDIRRLIKQHLDTIINACHQPCVNASTATRPYPVDHPPHPRV